MASCQNQEPHKQHQIFTSGRENAFCPGVPAPTHDPDLLERLGTEMRKPVRSATLEQAGKALGFAGQQLAEASRTAISAMRAQEAVTRRTAEAAAAHGLCPECFRERDHEVWCSVYLTHCRTLIERALDELASAKVKMEAAGVMVAEIHAARQSGELQPNRPLPPPSSRGGF
jgi:hypothetical protein